MPFTELRTNGLRSPLGLDSPNPEFQWRLTRPLTSADSQIQCRLRVSRSGTFDLNTLEWESNTINTEAGQLRVQYEGKPLESRTRYYWCIYISDRGEGTSTFHTSAEQSWFETGLLSPNDWTAQWISSVITHGRSNDKPIYLRGQVDVPHQPLRGRAYATACGWYKLFINGVDVTGTALVPRWTPFDQYIEYQVYDITSNLQVGTNHVSIVVADGRFRGHLGLEGRACYGTRLAALVQIETHCDDGTFLSTGTNDTWRSFDGPIVHSDSKHGQVTDARHVPDEWLGLCQMDPPGEGLNPEAGLTEILPTPTMKLVCEEVERVQELFRIRCQSVTRSPKGCQIIDFGQNIVGIVDIRLRGKAGSVVTLSYSEIVGKDGEVNLSYVAPWLMPDKPQRDIVYLSGEEVNYRPWFGIYGFRYVEVKGLDESLTTSDVQGIVLGTDFAHSTHTDPMDPLQCQSAISLSNFHCSDVRLEKLYQNVFWSTLGNLTDTATDCPTRERMGWTGDIQIFVPTATKFFNVAPFFRRYLKNLAAEQLHNGNVPPFIPSGASRHRGGMSYFGQVTSQSTGWGDASVIVPWFLYWYYDDKGILASQYSSMCRWVDSLARRAREGTSWRRWFFGRTKAVEQYILDTGFQWGEWLRASDPFTSTLAQVVWDSPAISTAYLAYSADLLSRAAGVLGKEEDRALYYGLYQQTAKAWREAFVKDSGRRIADDRQDDYIRGLAFSLLEPHQRKGAIDRLVELVEAAGFHLTTGFMSTGLLLPTLADNGRSDVAYRVLLQDTTPSWLYQVQTGATTMWETWEGYDKSGNAFMSHNHYAFGTVAQWLQEGIAGISPMTSGWRRIKIAPYIGGGLSHAGASVDSPHGLVSSSWNLDATTGRVELDVNIPPCCVAEVVMENRRTETVGPAYHRITIYGVY
ncbi:putative alfa-L-rhamnosidase [Apiospora arundinis]